MEATINRPLFHSEFELPFIKGFLDDLEGFYIAQLHMSLHVPYIYTFYVFYILR